MGVNLGNILNEQKNRNTTTTKKKLPWYKQIVQKPKVFDDGYQFGDISKTIGGSVADLTLNVAEGVARVGEGTGKAISSVIAEGADLLGYDNYANKVRHNIATKEPPVSKFLNNLQAKVDNASIFAPTGDEIASAVGYTAGLAEGGKLLPNKGNIPVGKLNVPALAAVSGVGSGFEEAYKKGAKGTQAWTKALGSGAIEGVTEGLFGMFGVGGNEITDQWGKQLANNFKSGIAKTLAKTGVSATGEAAEEFLAYAGNQGLDWLIDKVTSQNDPKFYENWDWEKVGEEMAIAFISAGISQGGSTALNVNQQYNVAVNEEQNRLGRQLTTQEKQNIRNNVTNAVISETAIKENNDEEQLDEDIQNEINQLIEQRENTKNVQQIEQIDTRINELQQQLNQVNDNIQEIQNVAENTQNEGINEQIESKANVPINQTKINLPNAVVNQNNIEIKNQESVNDSFNLKQKNIVPIEQRVSGNNLLDALDLIDEIKSVGAKVDNNGYVTLYHQTTSENAKQILKNGYMTTSGENYVYFSTSENAQQSQGRGNTKIEFKIPAERLILDDIFSDNADVKMLLDANKQLNVNDYLVQKDALNYSESTKLPFDEQVDLWAEGKWNNRSQLVLFQNMPQLYLDLGIKDNPMTLSASKMDRIVNNSGNQKGEYHGLGIDVVKQLPQAISNPLNILESSTVKDSIVVVTELSDSNDNIVVVSIAINGTGRIEVTDVNNKNEIKNIPSNVMTSAYGRNNYELWIEENRNRIVYDKDDGIVKKRVNGDWLQLPIRTNSSVNNNTTNSSKNQVVLPINNDMQQNKSNILTNQEIQGINATKSQVEDAVYNKFEEMMGEYGFDVDDIQGVYLHGSRLRGTANQNSDLDAVVFYIGNENEDYIFNTINDENNQLVIDGVKVDINPISIDSLSEMDEYISKSEQYDKEVLSNKKEAKLPTAKEEKIIPKNPTKEESYEKKKTRKDIQNELLDEMGITISDLDSGKDISSIGFQRTDPIRLNEKVFGYEVGQKINDATINRTKHNEAERTRFLNQERESIKELGIKARSKESAAVQKYAEKQYVNDKGEVVKYDDLTLEAEFPDIETQNKIKKAAKELRNKYDNYIDEINKSITEMGYDPIPKRRDYMKHFNELSDKLSQWGIPLNRKSLSDDALPTDINGITDQFKPGKNWFASAMQRKGINTTYDAISGIDSYLEGASNLIYHTEDIQRYRSLSKLIRETYGQDHGLDNVDLSTEEGQKRLNDIFDNKLSKYVAWLDEQANALAGKKGAIDRGAERALGRRIYGVIDAAKKQVGSNMTGYNVRSALTNFASAVQGASKTNKAAFVKGTISTVQNIIHNDGLINKSDFLTSRFGSDMISKKMWQKASNAGQIFMRGTDYFTANQIWRSKYYENLQKGMNETSAIKNADDFAARIMGDRSKGATAEIFNSKTLGLLTQFQLEVNNQWSSIIHDNKMDLQSGNKSGATVVFQLGQLAAFSYFFNNFMRSFTGSDVMIDPIDILKKIFGGDDDDDKTIEERAMDVFGDIIDDMPFVSFLTGGRIPVSEAFKGVGTGVKYITGQSNGYGQKYKLEDVKKDLIESAFYWLLPTGYGQIRKTVKGLSMYDPALPTPGSYTASGNLRFKADESTGGKIKAILFGQYSSKESQKYLDSGYKAISKNRIQEIDDLGMTTSEYRKYQKGLKEAGTTNADKIDYIANSKYTNKQKNIMAKNILKRDFDIKDYKKYGSYEEYDYAYKNPEKYAVISQITDYEKYTKYKEELKNIRENTTNDKYETIKYINSLNLSIPQKAIFIKMYYPSFNEYNSDIVNYINNKPLSIKEKTTILEKLKFEIRDGKVYW